MTPLTVVVHVLGALDRGGAETRTLELVRRVRPDTVRTVVVSLDGHDRGLASDFRAAGASVVPLSVSAPTFVTDFARLLHRERATAVHAHVATFSGAVLAIARLAGVGQRIAHFRSDDTESQPSPIKRGQRAVMRWLIERYATDIVGVSPSSLTYGWQAGWESDPRCRVMLSGIDLEPFGRQSDRREVRRDLGAQTSDEQVIAHIGRGVSLKNRDRAIAIFAALHEIKPLTRLVFIGKDTDADRASWSRLAADADVAEHVSFLGDRNDVPRLLNGIDLLLLTSFYEGLPGVVVEAAAAGVPCVGSALPGVEYLAARLQGIHAVSLDDSDDDWARVAAACLDHRPTDDSRRDALARMRGGQFDLARCVPEFESLWRGRQNDLVSEVNGWTSSK